jgi:hypothetical protein
MTFLILIPSIHLNKALQKIYSRQVLNEYEIYGFHAFVHEYTHHLQTYIRIGKLEAINRNILEALTEIEARKKTIDFLEQVYKSIKNNLDFRKIISNSFAYSNEIRILNEFIKEYGDSKTFDLFTKESRKKKFDVYHSKYILLKIINKNKAEKDKIDINMIEKIFGNKN